MKKTSLLIVSALISIQLVAQESELKANLKATNQFDSINLNTYKQADYKQTRMSVDFGLNGGSFRNKNTSTSNIQNEAFSNGSVSFSKIKSSRDYIGNQYINFVYDAGFSVDDYVSNSDYLNEVNLGISVTTNNRFYLTNNFFYALNLQVYNTANYNLKKHNSDFYDSKEINNDFQTSSYSSIQFGKGRTENVTDARLAIYILDDLIKHGRLSRTPSEKEVFEFADFITKTLNKRVIDDRIKQIMEYVAVDSFLVAKELTTKSDGLYFGLINDNWKYARLQDWSTGKTIYLEISPSLSYYNSLNKVDEYNVIITDQTFEHTNYGIGINLGYDSYWIKGLKRKDGFRVNSSFNLFWNHQVPNATKSYQSLLANIGYERSYIPNTRTYITASTLLFAGKYFNYDYYNIIINPTISGSCNYYFSEKIRLSVNSSLFYRFGKDHSFNDYESNNLRFTISASLKYYIF